MALILVEEVFISQIGMSGMIVMSGKVMESNVGVFRFGK